MIDIHTHIIYGIDDGARDFDESLNMIQMAAQAGTKKMIATSHYMRDTFPYDFSLYNERLQELNNYCRGNNIDLELVKGHELFLTADSIKDVEAGLVNTLGESNYILVEISSFMKMSQAEELMDILVNNGKRILIAHIERLDIVLSDFNLIKRWFEKGYCFQINASSLIRKDYEEHYKAAHKLMAKGMVHIIASDGHRSNRRRPLLNKAYDYCCKTLGQEGARLLFAKNPDYLLQGHQMVGLYDTIYYKNYRMRRLRLKLKGEH